MQERFRKEGQGQLEEGCSCLPPSTPVSLHSTPVSICLNRSASYLMFIVYYFILFTSNQLTVNSPIPRRFICPFVLILILQFSF
jgi:hypothetical protein